MRLLLVTYLLIAFALGALIADAVFLVSTPRDPAPLGVKVALGIMFALMLEKILRGAIDDEKRRDQ